MPNDPQDVQTLFLRLVELPPADRPAALDRECGSDADLRQRIEGLLKAHEESDSLLDRSSDRFDATVLSDMDNAAHTNAAEDADEDRTQLSGSNRSGSPGTSETNIREESIVGAVIADRYMMVQRIGEGGMGEVWMAKQTSPVKRKVALKLIKMGMDSKAVLARFDQERQALALMDHPNIAKVLDGGITATGQPFFVMELVNGLPLNKFCDESRLDTNGRLELFVAICQAVQHAHQKGIAHRDLKPANILVTLIDGRPVPKVIDFGVAKATSGKLTDESLSTQFGAVVGTLEYMSPEQAGFSGEDIDTRADIYSLGVILYELLTGLRPIDTQRLKKAALTEMIRIIREEEPSRPSTRLSTDDSLPSMAALRQTEPKKLMALLRGELDWVVMKCLEKQRDRRYETANALARDVQRYLADEPVEARPPSVRYRMQKFISRNKGQVIAAGLVLVALLAGMAGTTWGLFEAKRQEQIARGETKAAELARQAEAEQRSAAEKAAKEQTQRRLEQIEKGVEMFAGMLSGINPRNEGLGGLTLYEQLRDRTEQAADKLDIESVGDPLAVARLQTILGNTLRELGGNTAKAEEVLEKARQTRVKELGAEHPDTLITLAYLAMTYQDAGRFPEAIALFEQVRDEQLKTLGAEHPHTLITLGYVGNAYQVAGKFPKAIALFEQVRNAQVRTLGAGRPDTRATLQSLAMAYQATWRFPEAIVLFELVRDEQVKRLGAEHSDTLALLNNLARAYQDAGKLPEATALLEQVRDAKVRKLGDPHPDTLVTLNNLAAAYWEAKQLDKSVPLFEELLTHCEKELGRNHVNTQRMVANLGINYRDAGRLAEALPLMEEAYQSSRKRPALRFVGSALLDGYVRAGKRDVAVKLAAELLADARQQLPSDHPLLAGTLASVGLSLLTVEAFAEAEPLLRESLTIREKSQPDAWTTFNTQSMLGGALLGLQKYAEAEPLLLAGYDGMIRQKDSIPEPGNSRIPEALDRLIEFYNATDKPDDVEKWQTERKKYPTTAETENKNQ